MVAPVLKQSLGIGRDFPTVGIRQATPLVDEVAELVDDSRGWVILLLFCGESLAFIENQFRMGLFRFALSRLRNRRDEFCMAAALDDPLRRLALSIELPRAGWVLVRRIKDRMLEETVIQVGVFSELPKRRTIKMIPNREKSYSAASVV